MKASPFVVEISAFHHSSIGKADVIRGDPLSMGFARQGLHDVIAGYFANLCNL